MNATQIEIRRKFEAWIASVPARDPEHLAWMAWQASARVEREACAHLCDQDAALADPSKMEGERTLKHLFLSGAHCGAGVLATSIRRRDQEAA